MEDAELKTLTFKVSADDAEAIDKAVRASGLSRSDYIRQRLLNATKDNDKAALKASEDPVQLLHQVLYAVQRIISAQYQIPHLSGALTLEQLDTLAAHTGEKATTFLLNLDESLTKLDRRLAAARAQQKEGEGGALEMPFGASKAARWQAYQTRARMGLNLWLQIVTFVLIGWSLLTLLLIWHETGVYFPALQHAYFGQWILSGIITQSPLIRLLGPRMKIPANGAWYPVEPLADWLNGPHFYGAPFTAWFAHYGLRTALVPLLLAAAIIVPARFRHVINREHIRGLQLLGPRDHNRQLNGGYLARFGQRRDAVMLGNTSISASKQVEHFLITGSPGAGKSTLIRHMLAQIAERGQCAIVIDPDCEFVQEFYDDKRGDVVLNPLDARCPFWSPWLEFRDDSFTMDAEAMAASLIRTQARNANEEFFRESGRTLIEAIFAVVKDRHHPSTITDFLALPREEIQERLTGTRAFPLIDPGAHEQGAGILATAANAVKPFYNLPERNETPRAWSARGWAETRKGWVFLSSREDARAAIQRLQGVWLDSLVRWLMSAEIGSDQVWVMADELASMEYQPQIEKLVTRGRKRGLAVTMGFQNVSQLRSIYGHDGAITLTSSPTTKVILRCDEAETAKWTSDPLGSHEIEHMNMTQLAGLSTMREGVNLQPQRAVEQIVTAAEIQLLKPLNRYLCIAGFDRTTITIPERHLVKKHLAFVPRMKPGAAAGPSTAASGLTTIGGEEIIA